MLILVEKAATPQTSAMKLDDITRTALSRSVSIESSKPHNRAFTSSVTSLDLKASDTWYPGKASSTRGGHAYSGASGIIRSSIDSVSNAHPDMNRNIDDGRGVAPSAPNRANTTITMTDKPEGVPDRWFIEHHAVNLIKKIERKRTPYSRLLGQCKRGLSRAKGMRAEDPMDNNRRWTRPDANNDFRINFAELQRMRLRKLQCKLVKHVSDIRETRSETEGWEDDLETYSEHHPMIHLFVISTWNCYRLLLIHVTVKAVQDYDYMDNYSQLPRDPFLVSGERQVDSYVIHSIVSGLHSRNFEDPIKVNDPWEDGPQPIVDRKYREPPKPWLEGFQGRITIAAVAGLFLIGPMWLMVLHNELYTTLSVTTVFVAAFGLVMAWFLEKPKEVMSGTAAYAAVLVVFVGLGN